MFREDAGMSFAVWTCQAHCSILFPQAGTRMTQEAPQGSRRSFTPLGIIFAIIGLFLFAYFVRKAGVSQILDGIGRLGAGFLIIIAISAVRHIVRSIAWMMCMEEPYRLRFWDALRARLDVDVRGLIPR